VTAPSAVQHPRRPASSLTGIPRPPASRRRIDAPRPLD